MAATSTPGKPSILFVMADDVGWFNIGAHHRGMMAGRTPNLDRLASEGMMFTDYYAEASCPAGRADGRVPGAVRRAPVDDIAAVRLAAVCQN